MTRAAPGHPERSEGFHRLQTKGPPLRAALSVQASQMLALFYLGHVLGGGALRTLHDVELNPVALRKATEAFRLNGGVVDETILVPILRGDKTKTLRVVEPLHRADGASHCAYSMFICLRRRRTVRAPS